LYEIKGTKSILGNSSQLCQRLLVGDIFESAHQSDVDAYARKVSRAVAIANP
jgi:hypothetical protein